MTSWMWLAAGVSLLLVAAALLVSSARILGRIGDLDAPLDPAGGEPDRLLP
jgi:hypothetical protein